MVIRVVLVGIIYISTEIHFKIFMYGTKNPFIIKLFFFSYNFINNFKSLLIYSIFIRYLVTINFYVYHMIIYWYLFLNNFLFLGVINL